MSKTKGASNLSARPEQQQASGTNEARSARLQLADIARMAGVSTSTVSRALNKSTLISEKTRKRIEDLAKSLNFSINVAAQNLRLGENKTIAVVLPFDPSTPQNVSDPFFLSIIGSIANALTTRGMEMLLTRVNEDHLDSVSRYFDSGQAAGVIVIGQWRHHDQLNGLAARQLPFVVWGAQVAQQLYCTVGSNNVSGGYQATKYLLEIGNRRIVFLGDTSLPEVEQRYRGYLDAHAAMDVKPQADLCVNVPFLPDLAQPIIESMVVGDKKFDAVFAASDLLAITAMGCLMQHGRRVPEDVSVIGYDDIELSRHFHPALTTIRQPVSDAGVILVESLMNLINGKKVFPQYIETTLIKRRSVYLQDRMDRTRHKIKTKLSSLPNE